MGCGFYERGKREAKMLLDILSDFDVLWTMKEWKNSSIVETVHVSRVHNSLKSHRNVTKQTNPI